MSGDPDEPSPPERLALPLQSRTTSLARYFFQVHDGLDYPDDEGMELPSLQAARERAVRLAGELLMSSAPSFWDGREWSMDVTDDRGLTLFTLHFLATDAPSTQR